MINSGGNLGLSLITVPVMALPAQRLRQAGAATKAETHAVSVSQLKQQWLWFYSRGRATFPPLAATAALAYTYLAFHLPDDNVLAKWYITAAVSTISIVPFTLLVMMPTNNLLAASAARASSMKRESGEEDVGNKVVKQDGEDEEFLRLMMKWARLNYLRALLPLSGAVIGLTAALRR